MGLTLNFESDQQTIDNVEAITYTSTGIGGSSVPVLDAGMYLGAITEHAPSNGAYQRIDAKWSIRFSLLAPLGGAKPGDTITDSSSLVWTVITATPPVISGVWQISSLRLEIAPAFAQLGTLTRPSNTEQDSAGRQGLITYSTIAANVPCRLQPISGDAGDIQERRGMPRRFTAFLGSQVVPQSLDIFTVAGQGYTVLGFRNPQRIDELQTLTCELIDSTTVSPPPPPPPVPTSKYPVMGQHLKSFSGHSFMQG
jgi:hypothetical protein